MINNKEQFKEHPIFSEIEIILSKLNKLLELTEISMESKFAITKLHTILDNFKLSFDNADDYIITKNLLDETNQNITYIKNIIIRYESDINKTTILDELDVYESKINKTTSSINSTSINSISESNLLSLNQNLKTLDKITKSFDKQINNFKQAIENISIEATQSLEAIKDTNTQAENDFNSKITKQKTEIEKLTNEFQNKISQYQEDLSTIKKNSTNEIDQKSQNFSLKLTEIQKSFDLVASEIRKLEKEATQNFTKKSNDILAKKESELEDFKSNQIKIFHTLEEDTKKVVGAISNTVHSSQYKAAADKLHKTSRNWYIATILLSCIAIVLTAIWFVIKTINLNNWIDLIAKLCSTMTIYGLVVYCSNQAHKNQVLALKTQKIALELGTLEAFITKLDPQKQDVLIEKYAYKLFIESKDWIDFKDDKGASNIAKEIIQTLKNDNEINLTINKKDEK